MRHYLPLIGALGVLVVSCAPPAGAPAGKPSASPTAAATSSTAPSGTPASTAATAPAGGTPSGVATIVPGTSVAVPITYKLTVDGQPGEMEPAASFHNAPGSPGSIFWDIGIYAKTPGSAPTGALKAGQFACVVHCQGGAADPNFFANVRTLTDAEFTQAIKFTLREGVTVPAVTVPIAREWYVDGRSGGANMKGSLAVVNGVVTFKISATMPEDKYNGKPHVVDFEVSGLPKP